ncbi:hypothetical protein [Brevundimonas sp.]|uniref:hypothetical protein n=1 Tax=Brevundimonas sp. TaxID=1871086 RepID=UPI002FC6904B
MYKLAPLTAVLALALAAPTAVLADPGNGKGGDKQERGNRGGDDRGNGNGNGNAGRGHGNDHGRGGDDRPDVRVAVAPDGRALVVARDDRGPGRGNGRGDDVRDLRRELERQTFQTRDGRPVVYFSREDDRGLIAGCPPGLAKKNNGCLPPGQARQIARAAEASRYDWLWRGRGDDGRYEYRDGYLYRMNTQGSLLGWLPVLGGALSPGNAWPAQYQYQPAPDYYASYFGLPQNQQYRYADGALYGVDPQTQMISQVAALLTGQNLSVGQALPAGYDVYNVPYAYRNQYADNAEAMYRYNDGYVYQADPKTQLITAVIQLLT